MQQRAQRINNLFLCVWQQTAVSKFVFAEKKYAIFFCVWRRTGDRKFKRQMKKRTRRLMTNIFRFLSKVWWERKMAACVGHNDEGWWGTATVGFCRFALHHFFNDKLTAEKAGMYAISFPLVGAEAWKKEKQQLPVKNNESFIAYACVEKRRHGNSLDVKRVKIKIVVDWLERCVRAIALRYWIYSQLNVVLWHLLWGLLQK